MEPEVKEVETKTEQVETTETKQTETVALTPEELQKKIDELTRHSKNKEEEAARVQKKLAEFEAAEAERKKAELSELDRLKLESEQAAERATKAEKELADQRALIAAEKSFNEVVKKLNIAFANDRARENVFNQLDKSVVAGYEEAVKKIMTDEPYYFKALEVPDLDAKDKGKSKNGALTDAQTEELKKRYRIK